ncbi:MAG: carbohydrate kinase family protein [Pirellulales bacterium]|nr:carbohydrate kinase family protein [Pirellulales bacterium]
MNSRDSIDCVVCGSCVVDVLVRPVSLEGPIGRGKLVRTEPLALTTGGIVSNAGITMARLGMRVAALTYVGEDDWQNVVRTRYQAEGIDTTHLLTHPSAPTSTTAVLIDASGERSFLHAVGAPKLLDKRAFLDRQDLFARSRVMLLGYYPLLPNLQKDLPEVLAAVRKVGCQTALDTAADGGALHPLDECLPHLDYYVPSLAEAVNQTSEKDPRKILDVFRQAGASGLIGLKLGSDGALLSPQKDKFVDIAAAPPPGELVDTTGAGDCFLGGLLAGLLRDWSVAEAGRLAAATGACCVTGLGATTAVRNYAETARLAGLSH